MQEVMHEEYTWRVIEKYLNKETEEDRKYINRGGQHKVIVARHEAGCDLDEENRLKKSTIENNDKITKG